MRQLVFEAILEHSFRERDKVLRRYIERNATLYQEYARAITPDRTVPDQLWDRVAFAILSANAPFDRSVQALDYASACRGNADPRELKKLGMVPRKAEYLNRLPQGAATRALLRRNLERWSDYRLRLRKSVIGLGFTKASFAASLLYPLTSDLACIDTHMQRVYLGTTAFQYLSVAVYLAVERKVRVLASAYSINTFLAQWLIWDCARGTVSSHAIFPGGHKDDEVPF